MITDWFVYIRVISGHLFSHGLVRVHSCHSTFYIFATDCTNYHELLRVHSCHSWLSFFQRLGSCTFVSFVALNFCHEFHELSRMSCPEIGLQLAVKQIWTKYRRKYHRTKTNKPFKVSIGWNYRTNSKGEQHLMHYNLITAVLNGRFFSSLKYVFVRIKNKKAAILL